MIPAVRLALAFFLMLTSLAGAASVDEETRFLSAVRAAYTSKDKEAIMALTCWDRVTEEHKKMAPKALDFAVRLPVKSVKYTELDPARQTSFTKDGVTYGPNLPILKQVEVEYVVESGNQKSSFFVGEKDGKLMIVNLAPQP
jgi:hypothetical protein